MGRGDSTYKSRHKQAGALLLPTQNFVEARRGGGGEGGREGAIIQARLRCSKNGGKGGTEGSRILAPRRLLASLDATFTQRGAYILAF